MTEGGGELCAGFCCLLIFAIIGSVFMGLGCNPHVATSCAQYTPYSGFVTSTELAPRLCTRCVKYDTKHHCIQSSTVSCWDVLVHAKSSNSSEFNTCVYTVESDETSHATAVWHANKYPVGKKVNWLQGKGSHTCYTAMALEAYWYTGIVLLSLVGLTVACSLCSLCSVTTIGFVYTQNHPPIVYTPKHFTTIPCSNPPKEPTGLCNTHPQQKVQEQPQEKDKDKEKEKDKDKKPSLPVAAPTQVPISVSIQLPIVPPGTKDTYVQPTSTSVNRNQRPPGGNKGDIYSSMEDRQQWTYVSDKKPTVPSNPPLPPHANQTKRMEPTRAKTSVEQNAAKSYETGGLGEEERREIQKAFDLLYASEKDGSVPPTRSVQPTQTNASVYLTQPHIHTNTIPYPYRKQQHPYVPIRTSELARDTRVPCPFQATPTTITRNGYSKEEGPRESRFLYKGGVQKPVGSLSKTTDTSPFGVDEHGNAYGAYYV